MKIHKLKILSALILGCLFLFIAKWLIIKTPRGIDISPISEIKFNGQIDIIDNISANISVPLYHNKNYPIDAKMLLFGPRINDNSSNIYRGIEIAQFTANDSALKYYENYKKMFTDISDNWRLYKEYVKDNDRYFVSYETVHFDYNHGIPCGIVSKPNIIVVVLKYNIFIDISYVSYGKYDNYINDINDDIVYVSKLLQIQYGHGLRN